jgi:hypothetical protein
MVFTSNLIKKKWKEYLLDKASFIIQHKLYVSNIKPSEYMELKICMEVQKIVNTDQVT